MKNSNNWRPPILTLEKINKIVKNKIQDGTVIPFIEELEKRTKDDLKKDEIYAIDNIRENVMFYRGMDNELHDIDPSINRLYKKVPYNVNDEVKYINNLKNNVFLNEYKNKEIKVDLLARMQHYNYKSRLIDVTFNILVATYMASSSSFNTNGKVVEFAQETYYDIDESTTNIISNYRLTTHQGDYLKANLNYMNFLAKNITNFELPNSYKSGPVVVIDKKAFKHGSESHDLRYNSQEGAFIFFLNDFNLQNNQLDTKEFKSNKLKYNKINYYNKMSILYKLAESGITHVTVYPDKDISHEINKINAKAAVMKRTNDKSWFNEAINDYLWMFNYDSLLSYNDKNHLRNVSFNYRYNPRIIEFLLTDYLFLLLLKKELESSNNNTDKNKFNRGVETLAKSSKRNVFKYLLIKWR